MNRRIIIGGLIVLLALAALLWYLIRPAGEGAGEPNPTAQIAVAPLTRQSIAQRVEAFGVIAPAPGGELTIAAPFDGLVKAVRVAAGTRVDAGSVLLEFGPSPDSELAYRAAQNLQQVAQDNLAAVQERFELKLATTQELAAARQAADDARAHVASLTARGQGGVHAIRAAGAGVVTRVDVTPGAQVPMGAPLAGMAVVQQLEARLAVEGSERAVMARSQPVMLRSLQLGGPAICSSRLSSVGAALDPATGSIEVRAPVPARCPLLVGEHVSALIEVSRKTAALVVPRSAVLPEGATQVLYTVSNGKAVRHEVKVGIAEGDRLEVQGAGLQPGDSVVVTGNYELSDGMAVQSASAPAGSNP